MAPSVGKAFVVGPGYAPILGKLLAKITSGAFVELAEPHTYLDGKLLVAPAKKRVVEITDILTWIQAFTIYQWIFCSTYPSRWQDTTQYKLLILQMACQFPRPAWLNYDMAFSKDAAAYFLTNWSQMNLNLYNFHIQHHYWSISSSPDFAGPYLSLIEHQIQAFLRPHSVLSILE